MRQKPKKIFAGFRLTPEVLRELERLAETSGLDKTAIIEAAVMQARPIIARLLAERLKRSQALLQE